MSAIDATSSIAPRVRIDRGVAIVPKTRSYPVSGRSALVSHALSLEFSTYGRFFSTGIRPGPKIPGCTASRSLPRAQSFREPSSTARPEAG